MGIVGYMAMAAVGFVLGLIGGGGAILTMPILVYLFAIAPVDATRYSLFIVGMASAFGVWRYKKQAIIDYQLATIFVIPSFLGTYLARRILLPWIPDRVELADIGGVSKGQIVMTVFALVMISASVSMIRPKATSSQQETTQQKGLIGIICLGLLVGFVAGFVGAGGGFLIIPALVVLGGVSMRVAVPTSLLIIALNSLVAFGVDFVADTAGVDWGFLLGASAVAAVGLTMGVKVAPRISSTNLKVGFGWFVLAMGGWIFLKQFLEL